MSQDPEELSSLSLKLVFKRFAHVDQTGGYKCCSITLDLTNSIRGNKGWISTALYLFLILLIQNQLASAM